MATSMTAAIHRRCSPAAHMAVSRATATWSRSPGIRPRTCCWRLRISRTSRWRRSGRPPGGSICSSRQTRWRQAVLSVSAALRDESLRDLVARAGNRRDGAHVDAVRASFAQQQADDGDPLADERRQRLEYELQRALAIATLHRRRYCLDRLDTFRAARLRDPPTGVGPLLRKTSHDARQRSWRQFSRAPILR